jgi:DTW domain-containing protein YfiP
VRRGLTENRCPGCHIRKALCFCAQIPHLHLQTRVVMLMQVSEVVLTTNTAKLATRALANSELLVRGRKDQPLETRDLAAGDGSVLLLYPREPAIELTAEFAAGLKRPITLVVPDGSWRQTRKMVSRDTALAGLPRVKLPPGPPSEYRLRIQPEEGTVCTFEAIARALGILEEATAQAELEAVFRIMVERTLWSRGMLLAKDCTAAGIPEAARESLARRKPLPGTLQADPSRP